ASADVTLRSGQSVEVVSTADSTSTFAVSFTGNETNNNLVGNDGANTLRGEGGSDYLEGRGGADILDGGAGQDILEGGAGADTFRFAAASDTAFGAGDRIADFQSGLDKIDLSLIDANSNVPSDQQFAYIGSGAFTGSAGQLRSDTVGGQTHVYGDVNGDSVADFHFVGNVPVTAGDFIL
ncbi:MAG TPA: M10 family metallopeptidase C-terminal domain-containing protein, partial [Allosphingosinicella sp.]